MGSFLSTLLWSSPINGVSESRSGVVAVIEKDKRKSYDGLKDYLLKTLECPVCLKIKPGRIFQCKNGHNVCPSCQPQLVPNTCVLCKAQITTSRNYVAEQISARLVGVPCRNVLEGCAEVVPEGVTKMKQHMAQCAFSYRCFVTTHFAPSDRYTDGDSVRCEWRGCYREIMEHVEAAHPGHAHRDVTPMSVPDVDVSHLWRVCNHVTLLLSSGQLFWCHLAVYHETTSMLQLDPTRGKVKVNAYVRLVPTKTRAVGNCDRYACEFKIQSNRYAALSMSISAKPRPLACDLDEDEGESPLSVCACLLESFVSPGKRLTCTVRLTDEEANCGIVALVQ